MNVEMRNPEVGPEIQHSRPDPKIHGRKLTFALVGLGLGLFAAGLAPTPPATAAEVRVSHGLSLIGEPKYGPDFEHLDYVNPAAPKGGELRLFAIGGYDSLNPYIIKGVAAVARWMRRI